MTQRFEFYFSQKCIHSKALMKELLESSMLDSFDLVIVENNLRKAKAMGVTHTPALIVNKQLFLGNDAFQWFYMVQEKRRDMLNTTEKHTHPLAKARQEVDTPTLRQFQPMDTGFQPIHKIAPTTNTEANPIGNISQQIPSDLKPIEEKRAGLGKVTDNDIEAYMAQRDSILRNVKPPELTEAYNIDYSAAMKPKESKSTAQQQKRQPLQPF